MITDKTSQKDDFLDSVYDRLSEGKSLDTDEIDDHPYEVKKVEKMVPVTEWVPVKQDS